MDFEELKVSADSGDISSMIQLAKVNFDNGKYFESEELYTKAAESGSVVGYQMSLILKYILGHSGMQLTDKIYEDNVKEWEKNYDWALKWYQQLSGSMDEEQHNQIIEKIDDIRHYLALCYYFSDRFDDVISLTENSKSVKSSILYGISIIETDFSKDENWKAAYDKLSVIVDNEDYGIAPKGFWEELTYVLGAGLLSEIYHMGLHGYFDSNVDESYRILRFVKSQLKEQSSLNAMNEAIKKLDSPELVEEPTTDEINKPEKIHIEKKVVLCVNCGNKVNVTDGKCPLCNETIEYENGEPIGYGLPVEPDDGKDSKPLKKIIVIVTIFAVICACIPLIIGLWKDGTSNNSSDVTTTSSLQNNNTNSSFVEDVPVSNNRDEYDYNLPYNIDEPNEYCNYTSRIVDAEENLIMRTGPSSESEKVGSIANKSLVYIIGNSNQSEWSLVYYRYYDKYGWVNNKYLKTCSKAYISESQSLTTIDMDNVTYSIIPIDYIKDTVDADVGLVLRNGPSTNARWILRMEYGDNVQIIGRYTKDPDWVYVEYDDGIESYLGFTYAKYLSNYDKLEVIESDWFEYEEPDFIDCTVYGECYVDTYGEYDGDSLNMRSGPSRDYDLIVEVPDESNITLLGFSNTNNDWICVQYKGYAGWVLNKYVFPKQEYSYDIYTYGRINYDTPSHAGLVLRSGPSTSYEKVAVLSEGTIISFDDSYYDENNGYIEVSTLGSNPQSGYLLVEYLEGLGLVN